MDGGNDNVLMTCQRATCAKLKHFLFGLPYILSGQSWREREREAFTLSRHMVSMCEDCALSATEVGYLDNSWSECGRIVAADGNNHLLGWKSNKKMFV